MLTRIALVVAAAGLVTSVALVLAPLVPGAPPGPAVAAPDRPAVLGPGAAAGVGADVRLRGALMSGFYAVAVVLLTAERRGDPGGRPGSPAAG